MFNLEKLVEKINFSSASIFRFFLRIILPVFPFCFFLEKSRKDIPESTIIQLTPGSFYVITSYFLIIFIILQITASSSIYFLDKKLTHGTKNIQRIIHFFFKNYGIYLFIFYFPYLCNLLIPLSLDTLTNYSQKILGNFWIYSKILNFEANVLCGLIIFYQFPSFFSFFIQEEKKCQNFSRVWREIIVYSFIIGAWVTPSIDPITQIGCTFFTLILSIIYSSFAQKKTKKKYIGSTYLG